MPLVFVVGALMGLAIAAVCGPLMDALSNQDSASVSTAARHEVIVENARSLYLWPPNLVGARASIGGSDKARNATSVARPAVSPERGVAKRSRESSARSKAAKDDLPTTSTDLLSAGL